MIKLEHLHDATLLGFKVDWKLGDVEFDFRISREGKTSARISAKSISNVECPRLMPWGESISVNSITQEQLKVGILLTIEMQSGDYIKTTASEFVLEVS